MNRDIRHEPRDAEAARHRYRIFFVFVTPSSRGDEGSAGNSYPGKIPNWANRRNGYAADRSPAFSWLRVRPVGIPRGRATNSPARVPARWPFRSRSAELSRISARGL